MEKRLLRPNLEDREDIANYMAHGGYEGLANIKKTKPNQLVETLERSGLRGRGGAGFPSFRKWQGVLESKGTRYVVINATEGEPDSLKDRYLLFYRPHLILEGALIACRAVKSQTAWIVVNEAFTDGLQSLSQALNEAREANKLGKVEIRIMTAPPRYVVGEETALLNWIEGHPAKPRFKLHLPVHKGLWQQPTLIQNAETISNVPYIFREGENAYREVGTEKSPGTILFSLQGDVQQPGLYELPLGISLQQLIESGGGTRNGEAKAALIGGNFGGFLYGDALDVELDYESLKEAGGSLGCGIVRIYDERASVEQAADDVLHFFSEETCGQCGPCYMGTEAMHNEWKHYREDPEHGLEKLAEYSQQLRRKGACGLIDGAAIVAGTIVRYVNEEGGAQHESKG